MRGITQTVLYIQYFYCPSTYCPCSNAQPIHMLSFTHPARKFFGLTFQVKPSRKYLLDTQHALVWASPLGQTPALCQTSLIECRPVFRSTDTSCRLINITEDKKKKFRHVLQGKNVFWRFFLIFVFTTETSICCYLSFFSSYISYID